MVPLGLQGFVSLRIRQGIGSIVSWLFFDIDEREVCQPDDIS